MREYYNISLSEDSFLLKLYPFSIFTLYYSYYSLIEISIFKITIGFSINFNDNS